MNVICTCFVWVTFTLEGCLSYPATRGQSFRRSEQEADQCSLALLIFPWMVGAMFCSKMRLLLFICRNP